MNCAENETNIDEAARPELATRIWNRRAQVHLSGCVLHTHVEKSQLARDHCVRSVRKTHFSLERARAHLLLHMSQIVLRDGEVGVNRIVSLDQQQSVTAAVGRIAVAVASGIDDVTKIDQSLSGSSING